MIYKVYVYIYIYACVNTYIYIYISVFINTRVCVLYVMCAWCAWCFISFCACVICINMQYTHLRHRTTPWAREPPRCQGAASSDPSCLACPVLRLDYPHQLAVELAWWRVNTKKCNDSGVDYNRSFSSSEFGLPKRRFPVATRRIFTELSHPVALRIVAHHDLHLLAANSANWQPLDSLHPMDLLHQNEEKHPSPIHQTS